MKVNKPRSDLLVLEEFNYITAAVMVVFAVLLFVLGLVSLTEQNYEKFYGVLFGSLFCAFGFVLYFKKIRVEIDISKGRLSWSRKGVFFGREKDVNLADIKNVILMPVKDDTGNAEYLVFIITNRGKRPFNIYATNENQIRVTYASVSREEGESIAGLIREMTGMDSRGLIEDSMRELVLAGRDTEACSLAVKHLNLGITGAMDRIDKIREEIRNPAK